LFFSASAASLRRMPSCPPFYHAEVHLNVGGSSVGTKADAVNAFAFTLLP
jgi:hypothetical protein